LNRSGESQNKSVDALVKVEIDELTGNWSSSLVCSKCCNFESISGEKSRRIKTRDAKEGNARSVPLLLVYPPEQGAENRRGEGV
jgi:hypothetical protein